MDHALTREESQRLMELLNLPMEQFGNFHLMKRAFLSSIKKYHPDKGGDESMAKELISLYKKAECHVSSLETEDDTSFTTDEVQKADMFLYLRDWVECNMGFPCKCLFCMLRKRHNERKKNLLHNVWGTCYCFKCYILWFGLEHSWIIFLSWKGIIANTPYRCLDL
ncbi:small t antigen [Bat polyomavirus 6c]|uniref:Small t antigen n=1 Tax=Bat polyomavirus 6c TaxID=1623688 RepID=A0A0D5ZYM9_9POLY|nr:small t antigen [Bat polyomavirus 6c]BAQ55573.1 small t antigen [Bat polyomavirus 6c]